MNLLNQLTSRTHTSASLAPADAALVTMPNLSFLFLSFSSSSICEDTQNRQQNIQIATIKNSHLEVLKYEKGTFLETEETFMPKRSALFFNTSTST